MALRILLIDDDDLILETASRILRGRATVTTALDGKEGLRRLEKGSFDGIICDYDMPTMNGPKFLEELRVRHPGMVSKFAFHTSKFVAALDLHPVVLNKCSRFELLDCLDRWDVPRCKTSV